MKADHPTGAFAHFAETAEAIGATSKRLVKAELLGTYLRSLADTDLLRAARYFSGYAFSLRDQRNTNVGAAALLNAFTLVSDVPVDQLRVKLVQLGDPGDLAAAIFDAQQVTPAPLALADIEAFLEELALTSGSKRKVKLLAAILERTATAAERKYLVRLIAGDLRIGLKEGAVEDALARLYGESVERIQWVNMLLGDIGEAAVLARHGLLEEARMRLFHPIKFMLATASEVEEVGRQMPGGFFVEDKYDGIRAQVHVAPADENTGTTLHGTVSEGHRIAIFSRTLDEITHTFADLLPVFAALPLAEGIILDGEIVPVRGEQILPFGELQKRLGRKQLDTQILQAVPVAFVAYDLLYAEGRILVNAPQRDRQALLAALPLPGVWRTASQFFTGTAALDAEFTLARARGNEGLMVKDPDATYKPGRRGREWLKIKKALATLDVVITAAETGTGRRARYLSDYTFAVRTSEADPTLVNVGKAFSGITDRQMAELSDWCRAHTLAVFDHGKLHTVEAQIVLEVTFDNIQASDRYPGGFALRFPRILRIRDDKPASEIDTLTTVRHLAQPTRSDADAVPF